MAEKATLIAILTGKGNEMLLSRLIFKKEYKEGDEIR